MTHLLLGIFLFLKFQPDSTVLTIDVHGIKTGEGEVMVGIYNNSGDFFKKTLAAQQLRASNESLRFTFKLPVGTYAVAVYQDINDNGVLDKGLFSIPKEPYGLSNNFRPKFSAPTFGDCKFGLDSATTISIDLK